MDTTTHFGPNTVGLHPFTPRLRHRQTNNRGLATDSLVDRALDFPPLWAPSQASGTVCVDDVSSFCYEERGH
jgi:hypothetical protein